MRPVNLIPKEDRPGNRRPMRGGPLAYIVVGILAAALIGVVALVITDNQISERETEIVEIRAETRAAEAKAQRLAAYAEFHAIREQRLATVSSLADSRFDWERVMRELALVLPGNVWLTNLAGTVTPNVSLDGAPSIALRATVPGPALEIVGCGRNQEAVAGFVQALKQIDGVTRVGVQFSTRGGEAGGEGGSGSATASTCQTRNFIAQFQIVVAFDAAPVPETASEGEGEVPAPAPEASGEEGETATASNPEGAEEGEG